MNSSQLTSPIKNIQSVWGNNSRMTALYAPFRVRDANSVDYDAKMKFWGNAILNWCLERNTSIFSLKLLQEEFKRNERVPLCLDTVIDNLERSGEIKLKDEFLQINPEESWTKWAVNCFVKSPVVWSFTKLKLALLESDISELEYVSIGFLKKKSEKLLLYKEEVNISLFNLADFQKVLTNSEGICINQNTIKILLLWCQLNKTIKIKQINNDILIKFVKESKNSCIEDIDVSIYMLEKNRLAIEKAIEVLEEEKKEVVHKAKSFLETGMRDIAKTYLRRKKAIDLTIEKRVNASENIEVLLSRIQDASSDSEVLETYKFGLNALKLLFKEKGLSEKDVTNTLTEIQEVNEMHQEIQNALSESLSSTSDSELDEELKCILHQVKDISNAEEDVTFPEVPDHIPADSFLPVTEKKGSKHIVV